MYLPVRTTPSPPPPPPRRMGCISWIAIIIVIGTTIAWVTSRPTITGVATPMHESRPHFTITGVAVAAAAGDCASVAPDIPCGNPLQSPQTVLTQGYGVGSHAPAAVWGAIDLAIDGNGDGAADPAGSWGVPIYATHAGVVDASPGSWPGGNHVWVTGSRYRTGHAHLQDILVTDGQHVRRGTLIGTMGSTGLSSGPHLDFQVWQDGVNVNPLELPYLVIPGQ